MHEEHLEEQTSDVQFRFNQPLPAVSLDRRGLVPLNKLPVQHFSDQLLENFLFFSVFQACVQLWSPRELGVRLLETSLVLMFRYFNLFLQ